MTIVIKHGYYYHPLYEIWHSIKQRCYNSNHASYYNYGGRGITMADEWKDDPKSFIEWSLKNGWQKGLEIDRIDNSDNKQYSPQNCRFVTRKINCNNQRTNVNITYDGKTQTRTQWERELGFKPYLIRDRLDRGWSLEKTMTTKARYKKC